jgi:hypothetical protein
MNYVRRCVEALGFLVVAACGNVSSDAGPRDAPDGASCTADVACTTNPGAPCVTGKTTCAGGPRCVDDMAVADGTSCGSGQCVLGGCLAPATIAMDIDLSTTAVSAGRACAEAPSYSVTSVPSGSSVTVATVPTGDCLVAGDEVMLINLQGARGMTANVGNWELLRVASVAGALITFTSVRTRFYGATAGGDDSIGTAAGSQKVAVVRVPRLGATSIAAGKKVTTAGWDGIKGGVLAIRAARLVIGGTIDVSGAGYRPGRWSQSASACTVNVTTEGGESIGGPPAASTLHNAGGAGGIAAAQGPSFIASTPMSSTPGHATAGSLGFNANGRNLGEPGAVYGHADASTLTLGSGSSGNLTCSDTGDPNGQLVGGGIPGAGIVAVFAGDVIVSGGAIVATPSDAARDVASSGGYVYLRAANVDLGTGRVTARGAIAHGQAATAGLSNPAGNGYVVVHASGTVAGTSDPAASRP